MKALDEYFLMVVLTLLLNRVHVLANTAVKGWCISEHSFIPVTSLLETPYEVVLYISPGLISRILWYLYNSVCLWPEEEMTWFYCISDKPEPQVNTILQLWNGSERELNLCVKFWIQNKTWELILYCCLLVWVEKNNDGVWLKYCKQKFCLHTQRDDRGTENNAKHPPPQKKIDR